MLLVPSAYLSRVPTPNVATNGLPVIPLLPLSRFPDESVTPLLSSGFVCPSIVIFKKKVFRRNGALGVTVTLSAAGL